MHRITATTTIISLCLSACTAPADIDSGWETGDDTAEDGDYTEHEEPGDEQEPSLDGTGVDEPDGDERPPDPPEPGDSTGMEPPPDDAELPEHKKTECQHWLDRASAAAVDMGYEIQVDKANRVEARHVAGSADLSALCRDARQAELEIVDADGNYVVFEQFDTDADDSVGVRLVGDFPAFGTVERELVMYDGSTGTSHWEVQSSVGSALYQSNLDGSDPIYDGSFDAVREAFAQGAAKTHPWRDLHHVNMRASEHYGDLVDILGAAEVEPTIDRMIAYPIPKPPAHGDCDDECDDMYDECLQALAMCVAAFLVPEILGVACGLSFANCMGEASECYEAC